MEATILDFVKNLIAPIFTAILGYFVGRYQERQNRMEVKKEKHLGDLKSQVFRALLNQLQQFHFPVLQNDDLPIEVAYEIVPGGKTLTSPPRSEGRYTLRIKKSPVQGLNALLYKDAELHFSAFINEWKEFEKQYAQLCASYLSHTQDLAGIISKELQIPEHDLTGGTTQTEWVHLYLWAIVIVRGQLGIGDTQLSYELRTEQGSTFESDIRKYLQHIKEGTASAIRFARIRERGRSIELAQVKPETLETFLGIVDSLTGISSQGDELVKMTENCLEDAKRMEEMVQGIMIESMLPGTCRYVQV